MTTCNVCGSYALNDDPNKLLCDKCWRDAQITLLTERLAEAEAGYEACSDRWHGQLKFNATLVTERNRLRTKLAAAEESKMEWESMAQHEYNNRAAIEIGHKSLQERLAAAEETVGVLVELSSRRTRERNKAADNCTTLETKLAAAEELLRQAVAEWCEDYGQVILNKDWYARAKEVCSE